MKQGTLQWLLFTVGGALVGAIVVDYYRNYKADQKAEVKWMKWAIILLVAYILYKETK